MRCESRRKHTLTAIILYSNISQEDVKIKIMEVDWGHHPNENTLANYLCQPNIEHDTNALESVENPTC